MPTSWEKFNRRFNRQARRRERGGKWTYTQLTSPREVFSVLVEADSHDPIGRIKCLFNTVSMVDVNVDVEHAVVISSRG